MMQSDLPERRELPLFPLNTVLFPGAALPLQIFEDRYTQMLRDCLDDDMRFGVALIKSGNETGEPAIPYPMGSVAYITQVNEIRRGRFFVAITGESRFKIIRIVQYRPYMIADVDILPEPPADEAALAQMDEVKQALNRYMSLVSGLQGGWSSQTRASNDPVALSYYIAEVLRLDLTEKQALLEQPSTAMRLEAEREMLERDLDILRQRVAEEMRSKFSRQ